MAAVPIIVVSYNNYKYVENTLRQNVFVYSFDRFLVWNRHGDSDSGIAMAILMT